MNSFHCNKCNSVSHSSTRDIMECPYCSQEKLLVINPDILKAVPLISSARVIIDRRMTAQNTDVERRSSRVSVPIGWFVTGQE